MSRIYFLIAPFVMLGILGILGILGAYAQKTISGIL